MSDALTVPMSSDTMDSDGSSNVITEEMAEEMVEEMAEDMMTDDRSPKLYEPSNESMVADDVQSASTELNPLVLRPESDAVKKEVKQQIGPQRNNMGSAEEDEGRKCCCCWLGRKRKKKVKKNGKKVYTKKGGMRRSTRKMNKKRGKRTDRNPSISTSHSEHTDSIEMKHQLR